MHVLSLLMAYEYREKYALVLSSIIWVLSNPLNLSLKDEQAALCRFSKGISHDFFSILLKLAMDAQSSDQFIWALVSFENF